MKKVINGKLYDTETAKKCGEWDNGYYTNDFNYCSETLYLKKTGEYFLFGEGNALSSYASHSGNSSGWGEKIIPMSYDEAQTWAEKHLDGEKYIGIFGEPEEDDEKVQLKAYVSNVTLAKAKQNAAQAGITLSQYIEGLINGNI